MVRPDVMVVCGEQPEKHLEKPPVIVIELLSPSTRILDMGSKRRIYRDGGAKVYLIVDLDNKSIEINDMKTESAQSADTIAKFSVRKMVFEMPLESIFR